MSPTSITRAAVVIAIVALAGGCATTVEDDATVDTEAAEATTPAPVTTEELTGSAADLLPVIREEMRTLSGLIGGEGDEDAALDRIEQAWGSISAEIETTRPELFRGLEASIEMARTAVVSNRPADADKAYAIIGDLITAFERS